MPENETTDQTVGIQELRTIIHGLKMEGFAEIDDNETREYIVMMIGELPSPETLDSMIEDPQALKEIREYVGKIMGLIEQGGRRDASSKVRFETKKGIPPRYDILNRRTAMNKDILTRNLIAISEDADNNGNAELADHAIKVAKQAMNGNLSEKDFYKFAEECKNDDKMSREAQAGRLKQMWNDLTGGPGGKMQKERQKQEDKTKQKQQKTEQSVLNHLTYMSQLLDQDSYDINKVMQIHNNMPPSPPKEKIGELFTKVDQLRSQFLETIDTIGERAKGYIERWNDTGSFGDAMAEPVSQEPAEQEQQVEQTQQSTQPQPAQQQGAPQQPQQQGTQQKNIMNDAFDTSLQPGNTVQYTNQQGEEGSAIVHENQERVPEGYVRLKTDRNPNGFPVSEERVRQACKRHMLKKQAQSNKWVQIL